MVASRTMELQPEALALARRCLETTERSGVPLSLVRVERIDAHRVELVLSLREGSFVVVEWGENRDAETPAFARGDHFIASYNRRPGAWDLDDEGTPAEIRATVFGLCQRLAAIAPACSLEAVAQSEAPTAREDDPAAIALLVREVAARLEADLGTDRFPNAEGWVVEEVRPFRYWRLVADVRLKSPERHLGFLIFPTDPTESVYGRTLRHDVVYYSDDLAVDDHHAELYRRDHRTIDRFVAWLASWDQSIATS